MQQPESTAEPRQTPRRLPFMVRTSHLVRTSAFAFSFIVIGLHVAERDVSPLGWAVLALQFFVYPHLIHLRAQYAANPRRAELHNLMLDAALLGAWAAYLQFPLWITYGLLFGTSLNAVVNRGMAPLVASIGFFWLGAALSFSFGTPGFSPETSTLVTTLCVLGSLAYTCAVGYVLFRQTQHLSQTRSDVRESEHHFRVLAEHAGDLIAMVDSSGRWLYSSPSYERVLDPSDREIGTDAFQRVHPDDADDARAAVARTVGSGKPRDLRMRLVDRDGRVRQLEVRAQAIEEADRAPRSRIVLVSRDVTDLRENEERLLLAAHALEGMTEAIQITSADGTIVAVNKAFSEITGYSRDEALGRDESELRNALQPPTFYDELKAAVQRKGYWSGTTWSRRKNGAVYREWRSVRAVRDPTGRTTHFVAVFYEVGAPRTAAETTAC